MANDAQLKKLSELAPQIIDTPIDVLVTDPRWGTINFEMARQDIEVIFDMVRELQRLPVAIVPVPTTPTVCRSRCSCAAASGDGVSTSATTCGESASW